MPYVSSLRKRKSAQNISLPPKTKVLAVWPEPDGMHITIVVAHPNIVAWNGDVDAT